MKVRADVREEIVDLSWEQDMLEKSKVADVSQTDTLVNCLIS